jgi:uncharacterized delta-60 repeat protein
MKPWSSIIVSTFLLLCQFIYGQSISLDTDWAADGYAVIPDMGFEFTPYNYHLSDDGSILIAGSYVDDSDFFEDDNSMLMKLNPDGNLDAAFGINGIVQPELYYDERHEFFDVTILDNGKIRTGGFMQSGQGPGLSSIRMQFNPDGSLDTEYGTNGLVENYGGMTTGQSITDFYEGNDGIFYEAGTYFSSSFGDFAEIYIFRNGGFIGGPGDAFSYTSPNRGYVNSNNDFYLGLSFGGEDPTTTFPAIVKYAGDASGQDPAFDGDGQFNYMVDGVSGSYSDISGSPNGEIIAIGTINDGNTRKALLTKMLPDDGGLDMDFGDEGHLILEDEELNYFGNQIHYIESANVYLARIARTGAGSGLMAFHPDGSPVENFGINGTAWYNSYLDSTGITSSTLLDDETLLLRSSDFSYFVKLKIDLDYVNPYAIQALNSSQYRMYQSGNRIISLEIEEVNFDGDSLLKPYPNWIKTGFSCLSPDDASVLGKEVRVSTEGYHEFYNVFGDTIRIEFDAEQGTSWIAYTSPEGNQFVEATMLSEEIEPVLDNMDLVKTIGFQMLDANLNPINAEVNDWEMKYGAQYGLIRFPDLSNFPNYEWTEIQLMPMFDLVGLNDEGVQDLTTFDIFDFNIGDEIHYERAWQTGFNITIWQFAEEILARTDYADSIVYEIEIDSWSYSGPSAELNFGEPNTLIQFRTIEIDSLFDQPAGRPLLDQDLFGTFTWLEPTTQGISKNYYHGGPIYFGQIDNEEDSCFSDISDWGCNWAADYYIKGLGGPYYFCDPSLKSNSWQELLYYNKGGEEWGEPVSTFFRAQEKDALEIYPNPARDEIRVRGNFHLIDAIQVFSVDGRLLQQKVTTYPEGSEIVLDISSLTEGVYITQIEEDGVTHTGRFMVMR